MTQGIRVLIIDDDNEFLETLCTYFRTRGMIVAGLTDPADLGAAVPDADIVVCDINFPGESGFSVAARLRMTSRIGIIMLTGRQQPEDRLLGLSVGADHWLVKPANLGELELLIRNLHRRMQEGAGTGVAPAETAPADRRWHFDATLWRLAAPNGRSLRLTQSEYRFLHCLLRHAGEVVSREALLEALGRPNLESYRRNLDVTISRLRRKVERVCGERLPILSARGTGYVFTGHCAIGE